MLTLFIVATASGWYKIMWNGVDAVGVGIEPRFEAFPGWYLFFVGFILIGNFFILNLLVGAVLESFNKEREIEDGEAFLTPI